jgi:phosphoribosylanthranilate isomerase
VWVKICGNTNLEDTLLAAELGADAVGFVFAPSVRQVTAAQVAQITPYLPESLESVGVFPAWSAEQISAAVREAGLTTAQLHGGVDLELVQSLRESFGSDLRIIQTVHWSVEAADAADSVRNELENIATSGLAESALVDSKVGSALGGTGTSFDWAAAHNIFAEQTIRLNLILAGGLRPENVAEAIDRLQPWGVDVASGVEARAGQKDPEKMAKFIANAKIPRKRPLET